MKGNIEYLFLVANIAGRSKKEEKGLRSGQSEDKKLSPHFESW